MNGNGSGITFGPGVHVDSSGALVNRSMPNARAMQEPYAQGKVDIAGTCDNCRETISEMHGTLNDLENAKRQRQWGKSPNGGDLCHACLIDPYRIVIPDHVAIALGEKSREKITAIEAEHDHELKNIAEATAIRKKIDESLLSLTFEESAKLNKRIKTLADENLFIRSRALALREKLRSAIADDVKNAMPNLEKQSAELYVKIEEFNKKLAVLNIEKAKLENEIAIFFGRVRGIANHKRGLEDFLERERDIEARDEALQKKLSGL